MYCYKSPQRNTQWKRGDKAPINERGSFIQADRKITRVRWIGAGAFALPWSFSGLRERFRFPREISSGGALGTRTMDSSFEIKRNYTVTVEDGWIMDADVLPFLQPYKLRAETSERYVNRTHLCAVKTGTLPMKTPTIIAETKLWSSFIFPLFFVQKFEVPSG